MFVVIKIFISNLMLVKGVRSNGSEMNEWNGSEMNEWLEQQMNGNKTNNKEMKISFNRLNKN